MEEALKRVKSMSADMGGTEILEPLKHLQSAVLPGSPPTGTAHLHRPLQTNRFLSPSLLLSLFVFTDGEVWNTKEILDLVKITFTLTGEALLLCLLTTIISLFLGLIHNQLSVLLCWYLKDYPWTADS